MKYPLWKRFIVWINGRAKLELRQPQGFSAPVWFYLARCNEHGYFEDYLHGINISQYMNCPRCLK